MSDAKLVSSKEEVKNESAPETQATSIEKLPITEEPETAEAAAPESVVEESEEIVAPKGELEVEDLVIESELLEAKKSTELEEAITAADPANPELPAAVEVVEETDKVEVADVEEEGEITKDQEPDAVAEDAKVEKTPSFVEVYVEDKEPVKEEEAVNVEDKRKSEQPTGEAEKIEEAPKAPHVWWKKKPPPPKLPCEILTPNDSRDPSYTNLKLPYSVICRQRYEKCAKMYRKQFITEIKRQEEMQFRALDGIRIRREFCDPLIERLPRGDRIRLSYRQQCRLDELLNSKT